jgi:hypothetical protein
MAGGGALGGAVMAGLTVVVVSLVATPWAGLGCVIGAVAVLLALVGSQVLLIVIEKKPPQITMLAALLVMTTAAVGLIVLLSWVKTSTHLDARWVFVGVAAGAIGYLIGAKFAHSRVRLLLFSQVDPSDETPKS